MIEPDGVTGSLRHENAKRAHCLATAAGPAFGPSFLAAAIDRGRLAPRTLNQWTHSIGD